MSFGSPAPVKTAQNNLGGISQYAQNTIAPTAVADSSNAVGQGNNLLGMGTSAFNNGTNFLNTIMGGNAANTSALLQPSIDQIRSGVSNALTGVNTLTPRGGGRFSANYGLSFAPQQQTQQLYNSARTGAASALPQLGIGEQGVGSGLMGVGANFLNAGTGALNAGTNASSSLGNLGLTQEQINNQMMGQLGQGIFGLLTTPFGGGAAANGLLGLLGPAAAA